MITVFKPNCITSTSHAPAGTGTADVLAIEFLTHVNRTIDQVQLSQDPKTIKNYTNGSLDSIQTSLLLGQNVADILIVLPDRPKNSALYSSYRLDSNRTHVIVSGSQQGLKTETIFSFENHSETTPGNRPVLHYAVTLENGWVAATDIELEALRWGIDVLKRFETQLLLTPDAAPDFSTVSFDRSVMEKINKNSAD